MQGLRGVDYIMLYKLKFGIKYNRTASIYVSIVNLLPLGIVVTLFHFRDLARDCHRLIALRVSPLASDGISLTPMIRFNAF